jgi:hypothetical protein
VLARVLVRPLRRVLLGIPRRRAVKHPVVQLLELAGELVVLARVRLEVGDLLRELGDLRLERLNPRLAPLLLGQRVDVLALLLLLACPQPLPVRVGVRDARPHPLVRAALDVLPVLELFLADISDA